MSRRTRKKEPGEAGAGRDQKGRLFGSKLAALTAVVAAALAVVAVYAVASGQLWGAGSAEPSGPPSAVIVDQLSLTQSNPQFARTATQMLEKSGYTVDYFSGDEVTVDFYRGLASRGYDLLVMRTHSARLRQEWQGKTVDEVILFTNEPYSEIEHFEEQEEGRLSIARYTKDGDRLFGIAPGFIERSMPGTFDGAMVILMGCEGLGSEATADAFVAKGADSIISWNGLVSAPHTDKATENLLRLLVEDEASPAEAVASTMSDVGPDPTYGSELRLLSE